MIFYLCIQTLLFIGPFMSKYNLIHIWELLLTFAAALGLNIGRSASLLSTESDRTILGGLPVFQV